MVSQPSSMHLLRLLSLVSLLLCSAGLAQVPGKKGARVLIISIDGLRPDLLLRADTPHLQDLAAHGAFTFYANTTDAAITLPSHASMLTGYAPQAHGIEWNDTRPDAGFPTKPTLFELAKKAGYSTALIAGKSKFTTLAKPGTVDFVAIPAEEKAADADVAALAVGIVRDYQPQVIFLHLPSVDTIGHKHEWASQEQLAAIGEADRHVGEVLAALKEAGVLDATVIFVTSDHGGAGASHGGVDPRSRLIPWIVSGRGIRRGYDLTRQKELTVNIEDTFATAAQILGLPIPEDARGKPVLAAFLPAPK